MKPTKRRRVEWCLLFGHDWLDQSDFTDTEKWYGRRGEFYHGDNPPCTKCGAYKHGWSTWSWYLGWRKRQVVSALRGIKQRLMGPLMSWLWKKCGREPQHVLAYYDPKKRWHRIYRRAYEVYR
jgi:hypothetical protein